MANTMRCKETDFLLIEYYEGSLHPDKKERVKEHLAGCESCRLKLKEIEQTFQLLAKESIPPPEENFWANFLPQVRSRIEAQKKPELSFFPKPRLVFGLTSVLLVVALSFFLFSADKKRMVKLQTEPPLETILSESDLSSYTEQLAEILSAQSEESPPLQISLFRSETKNLKLAEKILEEDYLSHKNLNAILNELSIEELKQLEENIKNFQVGDIL